MNVACYDSRFLAIAAVLFVVGMYVAICRQVLQVFSRKRLMEIVPEGKRREVEVYLDREDEYTASLRSFDLLLRLALVLSLAFGRFMVSSQDGSGFTFAWALGQALLLAVETAVLFLIFLEIIPGIIARVHPEVRLLRRLKIMDLIHRGFAPIRSLTTRFVRSTVGLLGGKVDRPTADVLEEEILSAAEEGEREGLLRSRDIDMIESIISFGNVEVSEVMTPRTEMVCLDIDEPLDVNIQRAIDCGHSRIPVFRESKDNILGLLYVKDLLRYWKRKEALDLKDVLRKPHFVPLTKKIGELLQEFKTQRFHIAIILDEFGGTSGLVTIEDVIEEIVGEITDEYDKVDKAPVKRLEPDVFEVDGSLRITDLNDQLHISIPEGESYDTIGGFLFARMGRIPAVGDVLESDSLRFEVSAADERRIRRLRIRLPSGEGGATASPEEPTSVTGP